MLQQIYSWIAAAGYEHPLHPALTHLPIGAVFAAWLFAVLGNLKKNHELPRAAYFCALLALVMAVPTIALGLADWQHYYGGTLINAIRYKMILAGVLTAGLCAVVVTEHFSKNRQGSGLTLSALMTINLGLVIGLGFIGGDLVYGGKQPVAPVYYQAGATVFEANCVGCHARGGNVINPNMPLIGAPQLSSEANFLAFIRKPHMSDGAQGPMPSFDNTRLSDTDAAALYQYIANVLENPRAVSAPAP